MNQITNEQNAKVAYSVKEAATVSSLSVPHLRNEIRHKNLKISRIGRRVLILREDLEAYLRKGYEEQEGL